MDSIFQMAYVNIEGAREIAACYDKSDLDFDELVKRFHEEKFDAQVFAAELLLKHFPEELCEKMLMEMYDLDEKSLSLLLIEIFIKRADPEKVKEFILERIQKTQVSDLDFGMLLKLFPPTEEIRALALNKLKEFYKTKEA